MFSKDIAALDKHSDVWLMLGNISQILIYVGLSRINGELRKRPYARSYSKEGLRCRHYQFCPRVCQSRLATHL